MNWFLKIFKTNFLLYCGKMANQFTVVHIKDYGRLK
jgi:hypothetical protein